MDPGIQAQLAANLRRLRKLFGYTQAQVAERLYMCRSSYVQLELGRRMPDPYRLRDLAVLYHTSADLLLQPQCCIWMERCLQDQNQDDYFTLIEVYQQLSGYARGQLLERALILLEQDAADRAQNE